MINSENTDNFKNTNDLSNNIEAIVEVKEESFFIKLLNKIKNYFTRK